MRGKPRPRLGWMTGLLPALVLGAVAGTTGCFHHHRHHTEVHGGHGHGPPPHAPAHGHRRHHPHDDVELVFDTDLGIYIVVGHPGHYWDGARYIRWLDGHWRARARIGGAWVTIASDEVPRALSARHGKRHGRGHGHKKAVHRSPLHKHPAKHGH